MKKATAKTTRTPKKKIETDLAPRIESSLASNKYVPPIEEYFCRIKHSVNLGDIVSAMVACKRYWDVTGRKVIFYQTIGQKAAYYQGAVHPTKNELGEDVCVNEPMFKMMKPLVESQDYIHSFEKYEGQKHDLDFDVIRGQTFVGLPNLMIQSWIMFAFPDLSIDLSKPWITLNDIKNHPIKKQVEKKAIINFTQRYRNDRIEYFFLQNYAPDLIFAGTEHEHYLFCARWGLDVPLLKVKDFLEYAYALKYSRFILGNQSLGWNLAQAIHHPRVLELCNFAPNCQPMIGENSHGYFHQAGAEYYVRRMFNETK